VYTGGESFADEASKGIFNLCMMSASQQARHRAGIHLLASKTLNGGSGAFTASDATVAALSLGIKLSGYEGCGEQVLLSSEYSYDKGQVFRAS